MNKAIFIDKDGTLIENVPYNTNVEHITLTEGAGEGLALLKQAGYKIIIVTNQAGVAKGFFPEEDIFAVRDRIAELLETYAVTIDDFYYCPHHPEGIIKEYAIDCSCRKPLPGMITSAARKHTIDTTQSWMIGDILHDVEAGNRAGCKTILLDTGYETEWEINSLRIPTHITTTLRDAADLILRGTSNTYVYKRKLEHSKTYFKQLYK